MGKSADFQWWNYTILVVERTCSTKLSKSFLFSLNLPFVESVCPCPLQSSCLWFERRFACWQWRRVPSFWRCSQSVYQPPKSACRSYGVPHGRSAECECHTRQTYGFKAGNKFAPASWQNMCSPLCFSPLCVKGKYLLRYRCSGIRLSTSVFCLALRISLSLVVRFDLRSPQALQVGKCQPVKTEKRNILRLSSAPSSCSGNAKSFPHRLCLRKRGLHSTASYFASSNGLKRIVPWLTARYISRLNQQVPVYRCRGIALFLQMETIIIKKSIVRAVRGISSSLRLLTKVLSCLSELRLLRYVPSLLLSRWTLSSSALRASVVGVLPMPCK